MADSRHGERCSAQTTTFLLDARRARGTRTLPLLVLMAVANAAAFACSPPPAASGPATSPGAVQTSSGSAEPGAAVDPPEDLTPREQRDWRAMIARFTSPCPGANESVSQCLQHGDSCHLCKPAADFVAASIRAGFDEHQVQKRYMARFDPRKVQQIDIAGAPSMGPADAPVTIVEFADFECPFCAASMPLFDSLVEAYKPYVRFVFRNFPISYHPHGEECARAAVAAQRQGKFWELHHMMFTHRDHLSRKDILGYARKIGLDIEKFERDWDSDEVWKQVKKEREEGDRLGVPGTPGIFINGRMFDVQLFDPTGPDLLDWIELEIFLHTGKKVRPSSSLHAPGH